MKRGHFHSIQWWWKIASTSQSLLRVVLWHSLCGKSCQKTCLWFEELFNSGYWDYNYVLSWLRAFCFYESVGRWMNTGSMHFVHLYKFSWFSNGMFMCTLFLKVKVVSFSTCKGKGVLHVSCFCTVGIL